MPRRKRPMSPLLVTAGIACFVAGALGLLCGTCGAVDSATLLVNTGGNRDLKQFLQREAPAWVALITIRAFLLLALSITAITAGVGLTFRHRWARWVALGYGLVSVPLHLVHGIYGVAVYMPAMERYMTLQLKNAGPGSVTGFRGGFLATFLTPIIIWLVVSVFLIVTMLSPPTAQALAPRRPRKEELRDEDEEVFGDDDDYDRPRRRRRREDDDFE